MYKINNLQGYIEQHRKSSQFIITLNGAYVWKYRITILFTLHDIYQLGMLSHVSSCPILCDPMDCRPPGSSVQAILQVRILEWVAMTFSRGSSNPGIESPFLCLLHWQVSYLPLTQPGKPNTSIFKKREMKKGGQDSSSWHHYTVNWFHASFWYLAVLPASVWQVNWCAFNQPRETVSLEGVGVGEVY